MHRPDPIDAFFFQSHAVEPDGSQAHSMTNDTQMLDTLAARQGGAQVYGSLHDSVREVGIELRVPVSFLERTSEDRTAAYRGY